MKSSGRSGVQKKPDWTKPVRCRGMRRGKGFLYVGMHGLTDNKQVLNGLIMLVER